MGIINRNSLVLTFADIHRLSEMSSYDLNRLDEHLASKAVGDTYDLDEMQPYKELSDEIYVWDHDEIFKAI
jgi:hypothetical protein